MILDFISITLTISISIDSLNSLFHQFLMRKHIILVVDNINKENNFNLTH